MAKITRIKASDGPSKKEEADEPAITRKKVIVKDKKSEKAKRKDKKAAEKRVTTEKRTNKNPFILFRPFVYLGRYIRDSWRELRQVRWPNRKATWKMVLAVLVYTAIFVIFISLLDLFFTWLFNLILG
ncbi:preprotein translocase subunit SecE [Candidatus Nanosyncoccus alces]|uniref:Protein translocase subunit SecE n=1 Tax=Candidatus Nanosyncoccus alces TaxID=2171997 RepID=A0ABY0FML9_9BACT|nr:preprotein translocase subunit SecE [Candidatus Nanosyncoccus alces]RYC74428.1 Protein translocase subunit SecE [Candidatus Nanosyncoccus alces]